MTYVRVRHKAKRHWGRHVRFWLLALLICFLVALTSLGLKVLLEAPGQSQFQQYEPVDVRPPEPSTTHFRERLEQESRGMTKEEKEKYFFKNTPETG